MAPDLDSTKPGLADQPLEEAAISAMCSANSSTTPSSSSQFEEEDSGSLSESSSGSDNDDEWYDVESDPDSEIILRVGYAPFERATYARSDSLYFADEPDWQRRWPTERLRTGVQCIRFGNEFSIAE